MNTTNNQNELLPDDVDALVNRAGHYYNLDRYDDAIRDATRALELKPDNLIALATRALAYLLLDRCDDAALDIHRVQSIKARNGQVSCK